MGRILGEIAVLVLAVLLSIAVLGPAARVVIAGLHPSPLDTAFLVLGMVYGMVAPIGYFLVETALRRAFVLFAAAAAACAFAAASFLFETHRPAAAFAVLAALLCAGMAAGLIGAAVRRRRAEAIAAVEAGTVAVIVEAARAGSHGSAEMRQAALLAERLALAAAWMAAREAESGPGVAPRIDAALALLQADLAVNTVIAAAPFAARLIGEMRARLRPTARAAISRTRHGASLGFSEPLRQAP
ncbi:hypothetical protein [Oleispirillum naphthae]|uniref:hypothetical protein n=1 Tax=Oleispirillum naphthae TaxID=2838853 RepID=UPI00308250F0